MRDNKEKVHAEITKLNPWYVAEQLTSLNNPAQIRTIEQRWHFINKRIEKMHSLYPERKLKILDAGCGDGINLAILSKISYADVTACDYNPVRLDRAKKTFSNIKFIQQDLTDVQIEEDKFDIILCSQALEHIPEDTLVLRELKKVLSLDGVLIMGIPNEGCFLARLRNHVLEPYIARTTDHIHFYTEKELMNKFCSSGFYVTDKLYQNFFFPRQSINSFFARRDWGFKFMKILQKIFPSQAAGFYFVLKHSDMRYKTSS